uniref:Uncharacterized protein n=1 Tax=Opuntia streptacantha TaxID=393608 RepID=A0A7C9ELU2_OPUST
MTIFKGALKPVKTKREVSSSAAAEQEEEVVEPLSPGARLFHAPQMSCCIIAEMGCKTKIDVEVLKEGAKQSLLKHPRFSSKLVFDGKGKPIGWVRTPVNPDEHLIIPDVDPEMESPDQFVEDYVSNITKTPMDFSKPLWEVHVLHVKTSKANSVCIFRIHHSMGDGISLVSLLLACTRKSSDPDAVPSLPIDKKKKNKALQTCGSLGFLGYFVLILLFLKVLWNTLVDVVMFAATMIFLKDADTPLKGKPGIEKAPKRFVNRALSLDDIKLVKNAMDTTINDVILGITQAGLSRYLHRSYGKDKGDNKLQRDHQLKNIRLRSTLLVNLRPTTTIEGLAEMMEGKSKGRWQWGNAIAYILLPFHMDVKNDPLDYIRDAKATIDRKKRSLEAPCTYSIAKFILNILGLGITANLTYRVCCNTTMSFSNVVGPAEEISFYGHPIAYLAPSVYGHPQALTIHYQSYMDMMTVVLAVDPTVIPDPHKLCDDITISLKLSKEAVIQRNLVKS